MSSRTQPPVDDAAGTSPWYSEGLRFACQQCGACCRIEGYVWVGRDAIRRIAGYLKLSLDDFGRKYLRRVESRYAFLDKGNEPDKPNRDCIFWNDGCEIYPVRPPQCRTFPFWSEQMASEAAWEAGAKACHGMNRGRLYQIGEIRRIASGEAATDDGELGVDAACGHRE